ncbi:MAG: hypothetical protein AAF502_02290 [Bacteroidota bacterium]
MTRSLSHNNAFWYVLNTLICVIFLFSVFANIAFPLLWNDESHTVMQARFTAEFGYPKITDGKNIVYAYQVNPDGSYNRFNENLQASTLPIWAGYYWCVPAYWLAELTDNFYTKTLILRTWFAVTGIIGLFFMLRACIFLVEPKRRQIAVFLFLLLCTLNVSLSLHLREVRYYSLMILLSGLALYWIVHLYLGMARRPWLTKCLLSICLALMFFTFHPLYFIFVGFLGLWLLPGLFKTVTGKGKSVSVKCRKVLLRLFPILFSALLVVPTFGFFQPFAESGMTVPMRKNLQEIMGFLFTYDFLIPALFLKLCVIGFLLYTAVENSFYNIVDYRKMTGTFFFSLNFIVYLVVICRLPENTHLFTRYYLLLFPLMYASIIFDLLLVYDWAERVKLKWIRPALGIVLVVCICVSSIPAKLEIISERTYEMIHRYKGPLDIVIPMLDARFGKATEEMVLATNYEEPAFMYYLGTKTTVGFLGNNLPEDGMLVPDIIVFRKHWTKFSSIFEMFLSQNRYERVAFPVKDIPVNNLPQFDYRISHRFITPLPENASDSLEVFILRTE